MSGKIGKDFKYNFKFTKDGWQQYNPINPVASSVSAARWTNKLLRDATWIKPRQTASALVAEYRKLVADFPQLLGL